MSELTKNNLDTIKACRYCPMCRQACPSEFISYRESDAPRGRAILLHNVYMAENEFNESTIQAIYNCFVCGSCMSWCAGFEAGGYHIPELIKSARRDIVKRELAPGAVRQIRDSLVENDHPYPMDKTEAFTANAEEKHAEVLYFAGTGINFLNHEIGRAVLTILREMKVDFTLLNNEPSDGKILDLLGYREDARAKAEKLYKRIKATGCKTVVVSDPLTFDAFKNDYPAFGFHFEPEIKVLHFTEYIAPFITSEKLKTRKTKERVTLADSEFLGRFNNIYEAPREIIKWLAGNNFTEMRWNRAEMNPAGEAAFTFNERIFDKGPQLVEKIVTGAEETKAQKIITLSATAKNHLKNEVNTEVIDIAEFISGLIGM